GEAPAHPGADHGGEPAHPLQRKAIRGGGAGQKPKSGEAGKGEHEKAGEERGVDPLQPASRQRSQRGGGSPARVPGGQRWPVVGMRPDRVWSGVAVRKRGQAIRGGRWTGPGQTSPDIESSIARTPVRRPSEPLTAPISGDGPAVVVNAAAAYLAPMSQPPSIDAVLAELAEEFDLLGDWEGRIGYVIDLGRELPPLPEDARTEANKVPGCAAQVWLAVRRDGERLHFDADSDSALSKGNIALLLRLYSGRTPEEILDFDARAALERLGLPSALTRQRANGLNAMVGRIREEAIQASR